MASMLEVLITSLVALVAFASSSPLASPHERRDGTCESRLQRKAWYVQFLTLLNNPLKTMNRHTLSNVEKRSYIDAELCLMKVKATNGLPAARTRFDELQETHQIQANVVHGVVCSRCFRWLVNVHWKL
jgi:hypothetical protein